MVKRRRSSKKSKSLARRPKGRSTWYYVIISAIFLLAIVFVVISQWDTGGSTGELDRLTAFKREGSLSFVDPAGNRIETIAIEIADTETERRRGMMYRKPLDDSQGLLFVFPQQAELSFWMRNTPVALDMIFADSTGDIVTIHKDAQPFSQGQYQSTKPAKYVVEVAAGYADRYGITASDYIEWVRSDSVEVE
ncbi:DUF192 domain-containing protein [candidate division GN15 bacterium]|nr:DUF192 domain-containing protein [candidate division GN15 bacterium]